MKFTLLIIVLTGVFIAFCFIAAVATWKALIDVFREKIW